MYMCIVFCIVFLGFIILMSFSCFVFICYNKYYKMVFRKGICVVMCVGFYLIGIFLIFLNLVGIGGYFFDWKSLVCIWDWMVIYYYMVIFFVVLVWILVLFIGLFYICIYLMFRKNCRVVMDMMLYNL